MSAYAAALGALGIQHSSIFKETLSSRAQAWPILLGAFALLLIAYLSNPNDAAFRSFLTDLSFQSHLRRLRSAAAQATPLPNDAHVLNFSNRIAISLRTPPYVLRSFGLFSTVSMAPHAVKKGQVSDSGEAGQHGSPFTHRGGFFVGAFGHWWAIDDGSSEDGRAEKDRLASSVMAMEAVDIKPAESHKSSRRQSTTSLLAPNHRRSGSSSLQERPVDNAHKDLPYHVPTEATPVPPAVLELQQQLRDLQVSTAETESKLKADLEVLKTKKRDEDAARAELKARGKAAEDVKRQADHEHAEAVKRATAARSSKQTAADRAHAADTELTRLARKAADLTSKAKKSAETRNKREASLKTEVSQKQQELKEAEQNAQALADKVEELETAIEQRKQAIYARLMQPSLSRPGMLPYSTMPSPAVQWPAQGLRTSPTATQSSNSPSLGLDFGNVPAPLPVSSFLEHRLQHLSDTHTTSSVFAPFNSSSPLSVSTTTATRGVPLPLFSPLLDETEATLASVDAQHTDVGDVDGASLSPMTPNHRGLIPSTLFDMLDGDDDDLLDPAIDMHHLAGGNWLHTGESAQAAALAAARHPLTLNPDAKAFSFNRPLPARADSANNVPTVAQPRAADPWASTFSPFD